MFNNTPVAVLAHSHPSISKGGSEIAAYSMYLGLRSLGIDAIFVCAVPRERKSDLRLASKREKAVFFDAAQFDFFYNISHPDVSQDVEAILEEHDTEIAFFHHFLNFGTNTLRAASRKCRVYLTLHEFVAICFHHGQMITTNDHKLCYAASPGACRSCFPSRTTQQFGFRKSEFMAAFDCVSGFVSPSQFLADRFVDWGLDRDKIIVIENGLIGLDGAHTVKDALPPGPPWVFGFFGQINPFKGVQTIIQAVEEIARNKDLAESIKIRIHGNFVGVSDKFTKEFEEAVERNNFLEYHGPFDNSTVSNLMSDCHYIIMPSSWWENSPVVIQEAYAVGRPLLCTGIGGMAEKVVDGVTGLHFKRKDSRSLVRKMTEACDESLWTKLRTSVPTVLSARDMAQRYLAFAAPALSSATAEAPPLVSSPPLVVAETPGIEAHQG